MKLGIGLIGAGFVSEVHAEAYLEDERVELLALCDTNYQIAERFAHKYSIKKALDDYADLLDVNYIIKVTHHYKVKMTHPG